MIMAPGRSTDLRIDLHCHTTASDGTETPTELVASAGRAGLDVVAITDHDTTAGWAEATEAADAQGMALVRGIEISCQRDGRSIHLLGYLVDPANAPLQAELALARESRVTRLERMVELLADDGIPISYAAVLAHVPPGATAGRPHIADALVDAGVVADRDEAFRRWLHNDSPYYVRHYAPDPAVAVRLVLAAGGVPVIAHPFTRLRGGVLPDPIVEELAGAGLAGLEAEHSDHDEPTRRHARDVAAALGLLVTGSSDYHGTGKTSRLGQDRTAPETLERIEAMAAGVPIQRP